VTRGRRLDFIHSRPYTARGVLHVRESRRRPGGRRPLEYFVSCLLVIVKRTTGDRIFMLTTDTRNCPTIRALTSRLASCGRRMSSSSPPSGAHAKGSRSSCASTEDRVHTGSEVNPRGYTGVALANTIPGSFSAIRVARQASSGFNATGPPVDATLIVSSIRRGQQKLPQRSTKVK